MVKAAAAGAPPVNEPHGYPLVGHLPGYFQDRLGFLLRCDDGSGRPVRLRLGRTAYLLTDATDIEHVLIGNFRNYTKTPRLTGRRGRKLLGRGVLTSTGAEHLERRRTLQPLFARKRIAAFDMVVAAVAEEVAARWESGAVIDIVAEMTTLSRRVILRTVLGRHPEEPALEQALHARERYLEYRFRSLSPLPDVVPRPVVFGHRRALRQLERIFRSEITTARANEGAHDDLLAQLVAARGGEAALLSDDEILDELLVFSVTGYETMAAALAWTWYLLALHPEAEAQVQREADAPPGRPFTEAVLSEALRLYPPTWIFVRVALGADRLPSGLTIPPGAKLYLSQYVIQRSPRYFPEPERFDPSRFEPQALRSLPEFAYFPFGGGARLCIGKRLALLEGTLALASIAARHRLSLEGAAPVEPHPGVTLRPRGPLMMRVHSR